MREDNLLNRFNRRETEAFGEVYSLYYKELYLYSIRVYSGLGEDAKDVIQDVFLNIWTNKKLQFAVLADIKKYIYTSIKNKKISLLRHSKLVQDVEVDVLETDMKYAFHAAEAEVIALAPIVTSLLPEECAKVIGLSLQGFTIKEIAKELGKRESTIYNQRKDAINILKKKLSADKLMSLMLFLGM